MIGTVTPVQKRMPIARRFWLKYFLLALSLCGALHSQTTDSKRSLANTPVPTVSFAFDFPGADPSSYTVVVESTDAAVYHSAGATPVDTRRRVQRAPTSARRETASLTRFGGRVGRVGEPTEGLEPSTPALRERCSAS